MPANEHAMTDLVLVLENEVGARTIRNITENIEDNAYASLTATQQDEVLAMVDEATIDWQAPISASELIRIGVPILVIPGTKAPLSNENLVAVLEANLFLGDTRNDLANLQLCAAQGLLVEDDETDLDIRGDIRQMIFSGLDDRITEDTLIRSIRWDVGVTSYDEKTKTLSSVLVQINRSNTKRDHYTNFWINARISSDGFAHEVKVVNREEVKEKKPLASRSM